MSSCFGSFTRANDDVIRKKTARVTVEKIFAKFILEDRAMEGRKETNDVENKHRRDIISGN